MKGFIFRLIILSFSFLFISPINSKKAKSDYLISNNLVFDDKEELNNKIKDTKLKTEYILGPGDIINIYFLGIEEFSKVYNIDFEGYTYLPEIEEYKVSGLTIKELEENLNNEYKNYIKNPDIKISIIQNRPVSVFINGEVKNPGLYTIPYMKISSPSSLQNGNDVYLAPKLFDFLKLSNGFSNYADLQNVSITRRNSISQGGGKIKTSINLLSLLLEGDQTQNINIMDGDILHIPKAEELLKDQIISINRININPESIVVFITGNVVQRGPSILKNGSSLNQAIASNGGKKLLTGNIEFLRFSSSGSLNKDVFRYDQYALPNSRKNPILMDGDIINVKKTNLGKTTEIINEFSNPLFSGYGLYQFIKGL